MTKNIFKMQERYLHFEHEHSFFLGASEEQSRLSSSN